MDAHTHRHTHTCPESYNPSLNLLPNPPAPVIQIYELPLATICYYLQLRYDTSHDHTEI